MSLTPEQTLCKFLNDYLFHKVFNATEAEYRGNIIARCASVRETSYFNASTGLTETVTRLVSVSNYTDIDGGRIQLPDDKSYYLYMVPQTAMRGLRIRTASWQRLGDFLNTNCLDLRITTKDGLWLYRNEIFVCGHPTEKAYLLAVNTNMLRRIAGETYDATKIYVSVYYDSDMGLEDDTVKSQYFYLSNEYDKNAFLTAASQPNVTSVVLNGRFCQNLEAKQAYLGYYGEVITDPDKEFEFEIDLTDEDACRFYKSELCDGFKYIVHIPKALNPERYVYTHNTVDFYLFPKNGVNYNARGVFIHRFNTFNAIGQLTHQDYWISERLIQVYMEYIGTTDLKLRVLVRRHSKDQTLISDSNYLPLLYELTDEQILDHMEGKGPDNLWFWRASNLEQSIYVTLMFKSILDNPIEVSTLSKYIDAIGYYNVLAALCQRVKRGSMQSATQEFVVNLPVGLGTAQLLYAHLWVNKKRIDPSLFTVVRNNRHLQADFTVSDTITLNKGDSIITEIFERHPAKAERFTPTATKKTIAVGTKDIRIFAIHDLAEEDNPLNPLSKDYACDFSYDEMDVAYMGSFNDENDFTFADRYCTGEVEYLIITKEGLLNLSSIIQLEDIRGKLCSTGPILVNLYGFTETAESTPSSRKYVETKNVPMLWDVVPMVFVNGRELANEIDFHMKDYKTTLGRFVAKVIHISNVSYFNTYNLLNSATSKYVETQDASSGKIRYTFNDLGYSYLLAPKGSIKIDTTCSGAIAELTHILNTDPEEYGEVFTPTAQNAMTILVDERKDVYLLNTVIQEEVEKFRITGLTLVQKTSHNLDMEFTTDECFHKGTDFLCDGEIYKRDITVYYHNTLSAIQADGLPIKNITKDHYGYITTDDPDIRNGAFVYHRGMCASWVMRVLDEYGNKYADIERLGNILKYLDELDPHTYPEFIVTDRSHHICSVIINKVIDDTTTGVLKLSYDADEKNMLNQLRNTDTTKDYLSLIDEDPAMIGSSGEILVRNCGKEVLNATYTPLTVFIRGYNKGKDRVWINNERNAQIRWYPADQIVGGYPGRWVLENRMNEQKTYYYAIDSDGVNDPWNLVWLTGPNGEGSVPIMNFGGLNLRFIDIDPSYAEVAYKDEEHRKCILQVMKGLLPEDSIRDGGNQ